MESKGKGVKMNKLLLLGIVLLSSCGSQARVEIKNPYLASASSAYFKVETLDGDYMFSVLEIEKVWLYENKILMVDLVDGDYNAGANEVYFNDYVAFYWKAS